MPDVRLASLTVPRTARYAAVGPSPASATEWWIVLHGYGQLAADFLLQCRALDDGRRLVVAPEALSRYYEAGSAPSHADLKVGASWMTREDRAHEIADYLRYLDLLVASLAAGLEAPPPINVLGFSQGTATASRWVASGSQRVARFVCWGGTIAPELDLASPSAPLRNARVHLVIGTRDRFAPPEAVAREEARLAAASFPYEGHTFHGGHRLDDATLAAIASS